MSNTTIDFTHADGFPLTQRTLQIMQDSYREALKGLAALGGDMVILSGLEEDSGGSVLTDGWVFVDGELLPFEGGTKTARFVIEETVESRTFEPGVDKDVYMTRTAKFGSNPGHDYDFDGLTRLENLKDYRVDVENRLLELEDRILLSGTLDMGLIEFNGVANKSLTHNLLTAKGIEPDQYMVNLELVGEEYLGDMLRSDNGLLYIKLFNAISFQVVSKSPSPCYFKINYQLVRI